MRLSLRGAILRAVAALSLVACFSGIARATEGMTVPGGGSVDYRGQYEYTVPLVVPPGTAGMVPSLALHYSSENNDGIIGYGWELTGLAAITRCPRTVAQNGIHGGVNYDTNDQFCLNGQHLMLMTGSPYGADGTTYSTYIEGFTKVIAHTPVGNNGPAWFEVHLKSGTVLELGHTTDSAVNVNSTTVREWLLDKATDVSGNYLTVTYNSATGTERTSYGEAYPLEIDYTGNTGTATSPYNSVKFVYNTSRPDQATSYQAGVLQQNTVLLTDIKTYLGTTGTTTLVHDYQLGYRSGTSSLHSRLTSLTLCDTTGTKCAAPTSFTWQGGTGTMTANSVSNSGLLQGDTIAAGDFNGDGLTDIAAIAPSGCGSSNWIYTGANPTTGGLSANVGIFTASSMTATYTYWNTSHSPVNYSGAACFSNFDAGILVGDFDGDGFDDVLSVQKNASSNFFSSVLMNNKTGALNQVNLNTSQQSLAVLGDFDGDGRADGFSPTSLTTGHAYIGAGDGTFAADGGESGAGTTTALTYGDFDGDGCTDVLGQATSGTSKIFYFCQPAAATATISNFSANFIVAGDFNGDGKTDILVVTSTNAKIYLSTGTGLDGGHLVSGGGTWHNYNIVAGDFDGDGRTDVALISQTSGTNHQIMLSTGTGFTAGPTIANTTGASTAVVADWNNDGADDLWLKSSTDALYTFQYVPELMVEVDNGIGASTTIGYDRLNENGTFFTKGTTGRDTNGNVDIDGAYYVVSKISVSGGTTSYHTDYSYNDAKADPTTPPVATARGNIASSKLLTFAKISSLDSRTSLTTTLNWFTQRQLVGFFSSRVVTSSTGTLVSDSYAYDVSSPLGYGTNTLQLKTHDLARNDLDGTAFPTAHTFIDPANRDAYNNPTTVQDTLPDGFTRNTTLAYNNDTTDWIIGETTSQATESILGTSDVTRTQTYTPDATKGRLTQSFIEPGTTSLKLETDYAYDAFGNLHQTTVSGASISTRNPMTANYDTLGEFPTDITNAISGQTEYPTFDAGTGALTSLKDINSQTTNATVDWLGRTTQVTRPDGNLATLDYEFCHPYGGSATVCNPSGAAYYVTATPKRSAGSQNGPATTTYYDSLGRPIATDTQGFGGAWTRVETNYDGNGRVTTTSRPYFTGGGTAKYTTYTYDALGRVTQATTPDSTVTSYCYHGLTTSVTSDVGGPGHANQIKVTVLNDEGQVAKVIDNASATCTGATITGTTATFAYDGFGDVLTASDPASNTITNTYDTRGRKVTTVDPDMGAWDGKTWSFSYDQLSELTGQTDAIGNTATLSYDVLGRPTTDVEAGTSMPGLTSKWLWDATNGVGEAMNACTSTMCTSASYQRKPTYDSLGRVSLEKLIVEGTTYSYTPAYNADGRLDTLTYPSGFVAKYVYDSYGYLTQIQDNASGNAVWMANTVDAEGHVTAQTAGHGSHTMASTASYDANTGNVLDICASTNAGPCDGYAADFGYDWDALGRLKDRSDTYQGYTENFCYDGLNRLTNVAMGSSCTSSGTKTFAYDATGNMTEKSDVCATAGCMAYGGSGAGPHALTSITGTYNGVTNPTFTYDDNGNMLTGPNRTASYTSYNMTAKTTEGASAGAEFVYGPEHQRTKMCVPNCTSPTATTWYLYDPATGGISEKVVSGSTTTWRDYIVVPGAGLVAVRIKSGSSVTWLYEVPDHLGSAAAVVNVMGMTPSIERDSYDSWGRRRNADGTDNATCSVTSQIPRGYTDQEELDNLCLVNMNARLYDPTLGRFMSADSLVPNPMSSQSYNKYAYIEDSPTNGIDPSGNDNECQVDGNTVCNIDDTLGEGGDCDFDEGFNTGDPNAVETVVATGQRTTWGGYSFLDWYAQAILSFSQAIPGGNWRRAEEAMAKAMDTVETVVVTAPRIVEPYATGPIYDYSNLWNTANGGDGSGAVCRALGLLGANGRLRLGGDLAGGLGPYLKGGVGFSLRSDGSFEFDGYLGGGAGIGLYGGAALGIDNAGGTTQGGNFSVGRDITVEAGVPVFGLLGVSGSVTVPYGQNQSLTDPDPAQIGAALGVGPRYGLAGGLGYTATGTYRTTASICR
jgi:RHS repeat-associated protein